MDKSKCCGCEDDFYNHGGGGAKQCWMLESAKLIMRKRVSIDQVPPWTQEAETYPSCYHVKRFVFVKPDQTS